MFVAEKVLLLLVISLTAQGVRRIPKQSEGSICTTAEGSADRLDLIIFIYISSNNLTPVQTKVFIWPNDSLSVWPKEKQFCEIWGTCVESSRWLCYIVSPTVSFTLRWIRLIRYIKLRIGSNFYKKNTWYIDFEKRRLQCNCIMGQIM